MIHLVPVGLSIFDGLTTGGLRPAELGAKSAAKACTAVEGEFEQGRLEAVQTVIDGQFRDQLMLPQWSSRVSAEASSLGKAGIAEMDAVVLVATDTADGLRAATLNALRLSPSPVLLTDPVELSHSLAEGSVTIARVPKMDFAHANDFAASMEHLAKFVRLIHDYHQDVPIKFHVSGGYKAAMPFILSIAEALRTLRGGDERVTAWCVHETSDDLLQIPLRYFSPDHTDALIHDLQRVARGRPPEHGAALGYAYERVAGGYALSPYGRGLLSLLETQENGPDHGSS